MGAALSVLQRAGGPQQQTGAVELTAVLPAQVLMVNLSGPGDEFVSLFPVFV